MSPTPRKPRTAPDPEESNADRFKRVAGMRVNKALVMLDGIAKTSSKTTYEYTPEQAEKIVAALRAKVDGIEKAFEGRVSASTGFELQVSKRDRKARRKRRNIHARMRYIENERARCRKAVREIVAWAGSLNVAPVMTGMSSEDGFFQDRP